MAMAALWFKDPAQIAKITYFLDCFLYFTILLQNVCSQKGPDPKKCYYIFLQFQGQNLAIKSFKTIWCNGDIFSVKIVKLNFKKWGWGQRISG